jgi:hypothetical protein
VRIGRAAGPRKENSHPGGSGIRASSLDLAGKAVTAGKMLLDAGDLTIPNPGTCKRKISLL